MNQKANKHNPVILRNMRKDALLKSILAFAVICLSTFTVVWSWLFRDLPSLDEIPENLSVPTIRIVDRHGRTLYDVLDQEGGRHIPISIDAIPEDLKQATIATEDKTFYTNPGIDVIGILRALWINLQGGEILAGGSTITQQVARNLLLGPDEQFERTLRRKLRETWLAWQLSQQFTKDEILGLYLNQIYYGGLSYGVEAASQTYFGKSASELDLAEAALIAGIPQGPAIYNPLVNPEITISRQRTVLGLMLAQERISQDEYDLAIQEELRFASVPYPIEAPHFVMLVQAQLDEIIPVEKRHPNQTLVVHTTLDLDWQNLAERAIEKQLQALAAHDTSGQGLGAPEGHNVNNAALVALEPQNGKILALVGSPDYFDEEHAGAINMAITPRQPGSALKPLIYAAAFDPTRPDPWTAGTVLFDVNTTFTTQDGQAYAPSNYDRLEHGPVPARVALASSYNIPAVSALDFIGLTDFFNLANDLGIATLTNPEAYDLSLALGGGSVPLLELTAAYGVFANSGFRVVHHAIQQITTLEGEVIYQYESPATEQVLDEAVAWLITDILNDNEARTPGFGANSWLKLDRPAAVKTGTTSNFHDNWTIGFTPEVVVGVWVGNTSHEPMRGVTGLSGAAPIWHQFIRGVLSNTPQNWFQRPENLVEVEVCAFSGMLPTEDCPYTRLEWHIEGTQPDQEDTVFSRVWIDAVTGLPVDENTPSEDRYQITVLDLPPIAHAWAHGQGLVLHSDLVSESAPVNLENSPKLEILSPGNNSLYLISNSLGREAQKIHFQAVNTVPVQEIHFWLDGERVATLSQPPYETWWVLEFGEHTLWAEGILQNGDSVQSPVVHFSVGNQEGP